MGWNGSNSGFLGTKMAQKWVETHFSPTSNPFRDFRENPLFSQFKGVGKLFSKKGPEAVPTQHNGWKKLFTKKSSEPKKQNSFITRPLGTRGPQPFVKTPFGSCRCQILLTSHFACCTKFPKQDPRGPCETSNCLASKLTPRCLVAIFDSQLPSPKLISGTFRRPQPPRFSQKYCRTDGRCTAVQMGGVLQYKWEVYCWVSLSSRRRSQGGPAIQMGAYCRTNWRCTALLSSRPVGVGVSETLLKIVSSSNSWIASPL